MHFVVQHKWLAHNLSSFVSEQVDYLLGKQAYFGKTDSEVKYS